MSNLIGINLSQAKKKKILEIFKKFSINFQEIFKELSKSSIKKSIIKKSRTVKGTEKNNVISEKGRKKNKNNKTKIM